MFKPTGAIGATHGMPRLLLQAEGAVVFVAALICYSNIGANLTLFFVFLLAPDLAMLGYLLGPRIGALTYNACHTYLAPAALWAIGSAVGWPSALPFALIWLAHIGMDRAVGYGLKYPGAFKRTHLSSVE